MNRIILSVPVVLLIFTALLTAVYLLLIRFSARGKDHPEKYLPYSGGQELPRREVQLSYQAFFRIGLLFGILHVSALMISTLPLTSSSIVIGILYLVGISISVFVLAKTDNP